MNPNYNDLVNFVDASMPQMKRNWQKQFNEGYKARLAGKERVTHHARRRRLWFNGWDLADKELKQRRKEVMSNKS